MGGAERVLREFTRLWPQAPVYTLWADRRTVREHFPDTDIRTSSLQRVPGIRLLYPYLAPAMPSAIEAFDLSGYDTVLSSSVMFAKGIIVRPGTRHICYCYSPARMLWDRAAVYERRGVLSGVFRHALRSWDHAASQRPDQMVALSATVADRIGKYYRRHSMIIPPPVVTGVATETSIFNLQASSYYLVVGRLVPHKRLDTVMEAFNKLKYPLVIVGDGPLKRRLMSHARQNIRFVGSVSDEELARLYASCQAVIVPNEEDFGLTAVEAMAHGRPVLALRAGGATETVLEGITGEFYDDAIPEALADGVRRIRDARDRYDSAAIRAHAAQWSADRFAQRMRILIEPSA